MNLKRLTGYGRLLLTGLVLVGVLATATGCTHLNRLKTDKKLAPKSASAKKEKKVVPKQKQKFKLDTSEVLEEQMQELKSQHEQDEALIAPGAEITRKMDRWHMNAYQWMDNAVRKVDTMWLAEGTPYTTELSTFRVNVLTRMGGRGDEKKFDFKFNFNADLALPGLERKLHLIFDNSGRDSLPGADPMDQEDDIRLGFRAMSDIIRHSKIGFGGGARWRSSGPVGYLDIDWRWELDFARGMLWFEPRGFYYTDDGFGQNTTLGWRHQVRTNQVLQLISFERSTEKTDGFELEETLRYAWLRSGGLRGWLLQASLFPQYKNGSMTLDNALINITWRDALYRRWIYYTITPQLDFAEEDDYDPQPSIRIGVDILFGGQMRQLL
ncbi:MAG: hypothetical protein LBN38_04120 [Verrucomicrobiota bacterium]|jgi:hypothetical protein|nr:hypothetical protein [Verrucomicrobiota bacterium]